MTPSRLVVLASALYGAMGVAAWLWQSALMGEPLLYEGGSPGGINPLRDVAAGAAAAAFLVVLSRALTLGSRAGAALADRLAEVLGPLRGWHVAVLAGASGLGEELFFRGALQPRLGLVAASLLFGAAHLVPSWPLVLWSLFAAGAGFLFGGLFEHTGNLVAPVVAHVGVNALNLRWLVHRHARVSGAERAARHSRN